MKQSFLVTIYKLIFSESYVSLKKYSRALYIISFLMLLVNILSLTLLEKYSLPISEFLSMSEDGYDLFINSASLKLNILEASLGISAAMLDFIPSRFRTAVLN